MKKIYLVFIMIILLFSACAPAPVEAPLPIVTAVTPTHLVNLTPAELAAIEVVAENFNLATQDVTLISSEQEEWPDGCLGIAQEGIVCTQAITPGYRILLEADGKQVEYRTNEDGSQVRPATVLMTWKREGGIAGFCDVMTVYLSGEVHASSCNTNQEPVEVLLAEVQTLAQVTQLEEWTRDYGDVTVEMADPKTASDRMVITLEFFGLGNQQSLVATNEQEMLNFAQTLHVAVTNRSYP